MGRSLLRSAPAAQAARLLGLLLRSLLGLPPAIPALPAVPPALSSGPPSRIASSGLRSGFPRQPRRPRSVRSSVTRAAPVPWPPPHRHRNASPGKTRGRAGKPRIAPGSVRWRLFESSRLRPFGRGRGKNSSAGERQAQMRIAAVLLASIAAVTARAQVGPLNLGRHQDVSARAMARGGSFTAIANDFSALYYNPAGLSSIRKHEAQFTLEGSFLQGKGRTGAFPSGKGSQENLGVQSFGLVLPVPTERGGLSFSFGSFSARTFSDLLKFEDALTAGRGPYEYRAEGDLTQYRAGMAVDLSPDAVFGLALGYVNGEERIDIQDVPASRYLRSYGGFNLEPALLFKVTPRWRLGVS